MIGTQYTIVKPSFWYSRREIRDKMGGRVGYFNVTGWSQSYAEGEAHGRRFKFSFPGWDTRYTQMTDMSGQKIGSGEPVGWWGMEYKLTYGNEEYSFKVDMWGSTYMISQNGTELLRVYRGGYFREGTITVHREMDEKILLPLVLLGLYQSHMISMNTAASGSGGA